MSALQKHLKELEQRKYEDVTTRKDYIIHDDIHKQLDCKSRTEASGKRSYTIGDITLPSVTTVLGATKSKESQESLQRWRESVGEEEADRITKEAVQRGNWLHNMVEYHLIDDEKFKVPKMGTNNFALWKQMHGMLQRIDNIRCIEGALYSERLGMAGRVDCVADFDGVLSIIDFKTMRSEKQKSWITDYFLQETAYAIMYSEMHNVKVKQIVTLMSKDHDMNNPGRVFIEKPVDYVEELLTRVKKYKMMNK